MEHKKYCMIFNTLDTIDGIELDTFEEAKADMKDVYTTWKTEEMSDWKLTEDGAPQPTEGQIEDWDAMINECWCSVVEWDEEKQEYGDSYDGYSLSARELDEIGWKWWEELEFDKKLKEEN